MDFKKPGKAKEALISEDLLTRNGYLLLHQSPGSVKFVI